MLNSSLYLVHPLDRCKHRVAWSELTIAVGFCRLLKHMGWPELTIAVGSFSVMEAHGLLGADDCRRLSQWYASTWDGRS